MTDARWRPILQGRLRQRALRLVDEIARELAGSGTALPPIDAATRALFFAYVGEAVGRDSDHVRATEFLEQAVRLLAETEYPPVLYGGSVYVAWAVEHLTGGEAGAELDRFDERLLAGLSGTGTRGFDLIGGLAGLGLYAAERGPRTIASACAEAIVLQLSKLARPAQHGMAWWTSPEELPGWQRDLAPDGYYNLGVAHGIPGVIGVLAELAALDRARPLLHSAVEWLLATPRPPGGTSRFAPWLDPSPKLQPSRAAWCYGDPGAAACLFRAARAVEQPAWEDAAVDIVCATARRPARKCGVVDAALCHGAAGLGHIFNRFAQATGNEELERAAIDWLQRTLEMCAAPGWRRNTSLLTGSAGIGLALLAAASDLEPDWDQLLLLRLTSPEPGSGADSAQARRSQR